MSIWKFTGTRVHRPRWLFSSMLVAALGVGAPLAHAQYDDDATGDVDDVDESYDEPGEPAFPAESPAEPAESPASADSPPDMTGYSDWFNTMMDKAHKPFEYHGYFRSGFGINGKGGFQEAFQAPETPVKYRLGNETETYGELVFVNNWLNPERDSDKAWLKTQVLLTFVAQPSHNFDDYTFTIREAFVQAGNVLTAHPDIKFWAGQRYYRRHDIHINDFFHFSESGYGGGIEDVDVGFGKMALAYFGNADPGFNQVADLGRITENNLEARFYDFDVPGGKGIAALKLSYSRGVIDDDPVLENVPGFLLSFFHVRGGFMGGYNKASVQFGYGGSSDIESPLFYKAPTLALQESMQLLATDSAQINLAEDIWAQAAVIFRWRKEQDYQDMWFSAGIRPIFGIGKYTAVATELGLDNVSGDGPEGTLLKFTVAPTIRAGKGFWTRPEIRAYATAAYWTDGFTGQVGGQAHANDNFGLALGVQAENWW